MQGVNPHAPEGIGGKKLVWLTTPEEFAAQEVGRWITVPADRADAMLGRGVRKQVTRDMAMVWHRNHIETALQIEFPVAIASVQFHGVELPEGYIPEGEIFVKIKRTGRRRVAK